MRTSVFLAVLDINYAAINYQIVFKINKDKIMFLKC